MTLIEKLEAAKSQSGKLSEHNRTLDLAITIAQAYLSDPEVVGKVGLKITRDCGFTYNMGKNAASVALSALGGKI